MTEFLSESADFESSMGELTRLRGDLYAALYQLKNGGTHDELEFAANEMTRCQRELWSVVKELFDAILDEPSADKMDRFVQFVQAQEDELEYEFRVLYYGENNADDPDVKEVFARTFEDDLREQALIHAHRDYKFDDDDLYANAVGLTHLKHQPDDFEIDDNYTTICYNSKIEEAIGNLFPTFPLESQAAVIRAWKEESGEINPYEPEIKPAEALTDKELSAFNAIWGNYMREERAATAEPKQEIDENEPPFDIDSPVLEAIRPHYLRLNDSHNDLLEILEQASKSPNGRRRLLKQAELQAQEVTTAFRYLSEALKDYVDTETGKTIWTWIFTVQENARKKLVQAASEWQTPYVTEPNTIHYLAEANAYDGQNPMDRPLLSLSRSDALKAYDASVYGTLGLFRELH